MNDEFLVECPEEACQNVVDINVPHIDTMVPKVYKIGWLIRCERCNTSMSLENYLMLERKMKRLEVITS